jgi:ribonuclease D
MYIRTSTLLYDLCAQAQTAGRLALDLEFIREHSYAPRLALIQIAVNDTYAIVDPLDVGDLAPLHALVAAPDIVKVLHAAGQDMEVLCWDTATVPHQIFDTQIAAAMVGWGEQLSYGRLVEAAFGVVLPKGESYSDWLQRPLSLAQLTYALDDVRYLLPLYDLLTERLTASGRMTWVTEECRKFTNPDLYRRDPRRLFRRIRRGKTLAPPGLAILRELAMWRDAEARQRDRPPGSVLHDEVLVDIARKAPRTLDDLQRLRGLPGRELERSGTALLAMVEQGLVVPEEEYPCSEQSRGPTPAEELLVKFLDACLKALCQREKLSPTFVASRTDLEVLVRRYRQGRLAMEGSPMLEGWRGELVGREVLAVLEGRVSVSLHAKSGQVKFTPRHP